MYGSHCLFVYASIHADTCPSCIPHGPCDTLSAKQLRPNFKSFVGQEPTRDQHYFLLLLIDSCRIRQTCTAPAAISAVCTAPL